MTLRAFCQENKSKNYRLNASPESQYTHRRSRQNKRFLILTKLSGHPGVQLISSFTNCLDYCTILYTNVNLYAQFSFWLVRDRISVITWLVRVNKNGTWVCMYLLGSQCQFLIICHIDTRISFCKLKRNILELFSLKTGLNNSNFLCLLQN